MQFTQVPNQYAPVGGALRYALEAGAERRTVTVAVKEALWGATLGRKRFVGVTGAQFDIAPYVRRVVKFEPRAGRTGVYAPEGRVVEVVVEAAEAVEGLLGGAVAAGVEAGGGLLVAAVGGAEDTAAGNEGRAAGRVEGIGGEAGGGSVALSGGAEEHGAGGVEVGARESEAGVEASPEKAVAPARLFLPGMHAVTAPALITEMPRQRLIGRGEADELTLLVDAPGEVAVTAVAGREQVVARFELAGAGVHLFRLDMRDFAEAQSVRVDAGPCGVVEYTVVAVPEGARRVAWRSRAGSLEHYTFPEESATVVESQKVRAYGAGGYVAAGSEAWRMELASAYEERKVLEALSGILSSPQVWLASGAGYKAVDVLTERSAVYRRGVMSRMELALRPARKTRLPWN